MENENKKIVEINGVKLEIDMRYARKIENFCIGDKIKLLKEKYSEMKIYPGVIVGFENFKTKPTIVIAYLETDYSSADLKFLYFNADSKEEIVITDDEYLPIEKASVIDGMDRKIVKAKAEVADLERSKAYFLEHFNKYFEFKTEGVETDDI